MWNILEMTKIFVQESPLIIDGSKESLITKFHNTILSEIFSLLVYRGKNVQSLRSEKEIN
jgi:hypothetical protein